MKTVENRYKKFITMELVELLIVHWGYFMEDLVLDVNPAV